MISAVIATPQMIQRDYAARREAGALMPGETAPAPVYRAAMLRALPDAAPMEDGEDEAEKPSAGPARYPFIMSAATPDGARDIVEQDWDLSRFMGNPVAFFNHSSWALPIGRWEKVRVEGGVLRGDFIPSQAHDLAESVAKMLAEGTLRAASVGFVPGAVTDRSKYPTDHPYHSQRGYVFSRPMLLECSIVGVPMHPEAVSERSAEPDAPAAPDEPNTNPIEPVAKMSDLERTAKALEDAMRDLFSVSVVQT